MPFKMRSMYFIVVALAFIVTASSEIVKVQNGFIRGILGRSKNGHVFRKFYAIPYATPPIGKLRFKSPEKAKSWNGIRDASQLSNVCIQPKKRGIIDGPVVGDEDCLYLNVFAPVVRFSVYNSSISKLKKFQKLKSSKLATIVYIHGGSFTQGSGGQYHPEYFLDHPDVIFVTINYRLGAFGFFGMNNDIISGNYGMKDQSLALKWVKHNIRAFGGNPNNICLMGHSTGGSSVHLHMFSPLSKGLFNKVIMQSGNVFNYFAYPDEEYTRSTSMSYAVITGCYDKKPENILLCLQRIPAEELSKAESRLVIWNRNPLTTFRPTIESNVSYQPFLPIKPTQNAYQTVDIPSIIGLTPQEGAFLAIRYLMNESQSARTIDSNRQRLLPLINQYHGANQLEFVDIATEKIIEHYFGDKRIGPETDKELVDMLTDSVFAYPIIQGISSYPGPRYVYLYDYTIKSEAQSRLSIYPKNLGVGHCDELPLLFYYENTDNTLTSTDRKVSRTLLDFWVSFAQHSNPNSHLKKKIWKLAQTSAIEYLHIKSDNLTMESNLFNKVFRFWESLPLRK